jgi:hypothetical protein
MQRKCLSLRGRCLAAGSSHRAFRHSTTVADPADVQMLDLPQTKDKVRWRAARVLDLREEWPYVLGILGNH